MEMIVLKHIAQNFRLVFSGNGIFTSHNFIGYNCFSNSSYSTTFITNNM